ncbi:nitroreductase family protein [Clostridium thermosuccinogenes]|uniref:nitroreductase family protein n=1 Tax=Clostridium thermosuccinogenes TaxID=84032 RepID=UPI000CCBE142|nr:nitroreductase family protein [Pseudoclostridium thermosuccinogenes]PNT93828.1 nitroreductase [Pseudoclostridium thermosuccinogenes]
MEYFELIDKRYSVRGYKNDPVEDEKIKKILEAGRIAPTAANRQGFKILVINTKGREDELRKIYNKDWFVTAPVILGVCSIPEKCWVRYDGKNSSDVDAAIVMTHMILAARDLGLGTCWIGAFNVEAAKEVLGIDDSMEPVAFTPLGYYDEAGVQRKRKPMEELVIYK